MSGPEGRAAGGPGLQLVVPDISDVETSTRADTCAVLHDVLAQVESGEIVEVVLIGIAPTGADFIRHTETVDFARRVGLLELAKHVELARALSDD